MQQNSTFMFGFDPKHNIRLDWIYLQIFLVKIKEIVISIFLFFQEKKSSHSFLWLASVVYVIKKQ